MERRLIILQLSIGQNVVHPNHGIGKIVGVKRMDVVEGFNRYYVIEFARNLISHIPMRNTDDIGLRKTMSETKIDQVLDALAETPNDLPDNHKSRRKKLEDLLHSGYPMKIAEAVRDLAWRQHSNGLSNADNQLLSKGKDMLVSEMALVTDSGANKARRQINKALSQGVEAKEGQDNL